LKKRIYILLLIALGGLCKIFADGLPGEYVINDRWRALLADISPTSNPANIQDENYKAFSSAFSSILGEFFLQQSSFTLPIGLYQTASLSWLTHGAGSYPGSENFQPTQTISDASNTYILSYALQPISRLRAGVNLSFAHQSFNQTNDVGFGADIGLTWPVLWHPNYGYHRLGVSTINLIAPTLSEAYSRNLRLNVMSEYLNNQITSTVIFDLRDFFAKATDFLQNDPSQGTLISTAKSMEWAVQAKVGVWLARTLLLHGLTGFDNNGFDHIGFSGGVNAPALFYGKDLMLSYQFLNVNGGIGSSHTIYLRSEIGMHREEIFARQMARKTTVTPNRLYNQALELFSAGKYWDALFVFRKIETDHPQFHFNDWVSYYIGKSMEQMDMRDAALNRYTYTRSSFPKSNSIGKTILGQSIVSYRQGSYAQVEKFYLDAKSATADDSLVSHATYLYGQSLLKQAKYTKALEVFEQIADTMHHFHYARYSSASIYFILENIPKAQEQLLEAIQKEPSADLLPIFDLIQTTLGFSFLEQRLTPDSSLAKAVSLFRNVDKSSIQYPEAQLGLAWAAYYGGKPDDLLLAAGSIVEHAEDTALVAEGTMMQGIAYMIARDYNQAYAKLKEAETILTTFRPATIEDSISRENQTQEYRFSYQAVAQQMLQLSEQPTSSFVLESIETLHESQQKLQATLRGYTLWFDDYSLGAKHRSSIPRLKSDLEFALAKCRERITYEQANRIELKETQRRQAIDREIEQIQKQLQELQQQPD